MKTGADMSGGCMDFDFQRGTWSVRHRRLKQRLQACDEWEIFDGSCVQTPILGGNGNVEDNLLHLPTGDYRAIALRSYDSTQGTWAIWWLDGRAPHVLDTPVIGRFVDDVGTFYADDYHDGRQVRLRFLWLATRSPSPRWEQALSADGGATWETNWTMEFERSNTAS